MSRDSRSNRTGFKDRALRFESDFSPLLNTEQKKRQARISRKNFLINTILFLVFLLFAMILGEVTLHLIVPYRYLDAPLWTRQWRYDEVLGWRNLPYLKMKDAKEKYTLTNSRGLRNTRTYPYNRTGKKRIIISGDSFAFGFGMINNEECFHEIMMREHLPNTEIINMGVSGYGTDQSFLAYQLEGKNYQADVLIHIFYPNDFMDNICVYDYGGLLSPNYIYDKKEGLRLVNVPIPLCSGWGAEWLDPSNLREFMFLKSRAFYLWQKYKIKKIAKPAFKVRYNHIPAPQLLQKSSVTLDILRQFYLLCSRNHTFFILVTVPPLSMLEEKEWETIRQSLSFQSRDRFEPYENFFEPLQQEGVRIVHLSREFLDQHRRGVPFMDDQFAGHWNRQGHKYMAKRLSEIVKSEDGHRFSDSI